MKGLVAKRLTCAFHGCQGREATALAVFCRVTRGRVLTVSGLSLIALLVASAPALAIPQRGHVFSFGFGSKGKAAGQFSAPGGVAVDDLNGALFVADRKNKRVEEFMPVFDKVGGGLARNSRGN